MAKTAKNILSLNLDILLNKDGSYAVSTRQKIEGNMKVYVK